MRPQWKSIESSWLAFREDRLDPKFIALRTSCFATLISDLLCFPSMYNYQLPVFLAILGSLRHLDHLFHPGKWACNVLLPKGTAAINGKRGHNLKTCEGGTVSRSWLDFLCIILHWILIMYPTIWLLFVFSDANIWHLSGEPTIW